MQGPLVVTAVATVLGALATSGALIFVIYQRHQEAKDRLTAVTAWAVPFRATVGHTITLHLKNDTNTVVNDAHLMLAKRYSNGTMGVGLGISLSAAPRDVNHQALPNLPALPHEPEGGFDCYVHVIFHDARGRMWTRLADGTLKHGMARRFRVPPRTLGEKGRVTGLPIRQRIFFWVRGKVNRRK